MLYSCSPECTEPRHRQVKRLPRAARELIAGGRAVRLLKLK